MKVGLRAEQMVVRKVSKKAVRKDKHSAELMASTMGVSMVVRREAMKVVLLDTKTVATKV